MAGTLPVLALILVDGAMMMRFVWTRTRRQQSVLHWTRSDSSGPKTIRLPVAFRQETRPGLNLKQSLSGLRQGGQIPRPILRQHRH